MDKAAMKQFLDGLSGADKKELICLLLSEMLSAFDPLSEFCFMMDDATINGTGAGRPLGILGDQVNKLAAEVDVLTYRKEDR